MSHKVKGKAILPTLLAILSSCTTGSAPELRQESPVPGPDALYETGLHIAQRTEVPLDDPLFRAEPAIEDASYPVMFDFDSSGRGLWFSELKSGIVQMLDLIDATFRPYAEIEVCTKDDQGLLGIARHPRYPPTPQLFVYATVPIGGKCRNRLLRLVERNANATVDGFLLDWEYTGEHIGGRVAFGPDEALYISTGSGDADSSVQDLNSVHGKILRMTADGDPLPDNPFIGRGDPEDLVFAYGIRNSFGFTWDRETEYLWGTDNGTECNDEVDLVWAGANLGWGANAACDDPPSSTSILETNKDGPSPAMPRISYSPSDGPTGITFCNDCGVAALEGNLLYGAWRLGEIRALELDRSRTRVLAEKVVYRHHTAEFPLSLETDAEGQLWASDQVGIYRLVPAE